MTDYHLGTMGFSYQQWLGAFYPVGMNALQYLPYYAERFDAVEIDSTFYGTPAANVVARWAAVTPTGFRFCLKTPRQITHEMRLIDAGEAMATFLERAQLLGEKLGPVLLQFPPDFTIHQMRNLNNFLGQLPAQLRFAVEFRHTSWENEGTAVLLSRHRAAWVAADYIHMPRVIHRTADFLYLRFIGPHGQFAGKDREMVDKTADLRGWQKQIRPHLAAVDAVYAFFNNDYAGYAPATCNRFKEVLGLETKDIRVLRQGRLF